VSLSQGLTFPLQYKCAILAVILTLLADLRMKKESIAANCLALIMTVPGMLAQQPGDAAKGQRTFARCVVCHDAQSAETQTDSGPDELAGPGLKGVFRRDKLRNGKKVTEENVRAMLEDGGRGMPAFRDILSEEERANLIAYLKTL
jgi:cytochrome c